MKKTLIILLLVISASGHATVLKNNTGIFPFVSLQQKKANDKTTQDGKLPKASAIFWIDLEQNRSKEVKKIRNVKAKVSIDSEGKIKVLEYNKKQPVLIINKIEKSLRTFRVKPEWVASGKVKTGENIVFLRFLDEY